jgi:hypothetical protein
MSTLTFIELLRGGSLTENEKTKVLEDLRTGSDAPSTTASTGNPIVTVSFTTNDNVDEDDDTTNSLRGLISVNVDLLFENNLSIISFFPML